MTLCVDANLIVLRVASPDNASVQALWEGWHASGERIVTPNLAVYEVANALHQMVRGRILTHPSAAVVLRAALALPVESIDGRDLHERAFALAHALNLPAAYDAHYLALAEELGVELWTADARLWNSVRHQLDWVHLAAGDQP